MFTDIRHKFGLDESNRFVVKPRGEPNPSLEEAVKKLNEELNKLPRDESRKSDDGEEDYEDEGSSVFSTQTDSRSKAERKAERKSQKEEKRFRRRAEEIKEWASASAVGLPISSGSLRVSGYDQEFTSQDTKTPTNFKGKLPDPGNYGNVGLAFTSISDIDLQMEYLQAVKSRRMQEQEEERMRAKAARMQTSRSGYAGPSDWDASSLDRLIEKEKKEQLRTHRRYKSRSRSPSKEHNRDHDRKKEKNIKRDRVEHEVKHEYSTRQLHRGPPGIPDPSSEESSDDKRRDKIPKDSDTIDESELSDNDSDGPRYSVRKVAALAGRYKSRVQETKKAKNKEKRDKRHEEEKKERHTGRFASIKPSENLGQQSFLKQAIRRSSRRPTSPPSSSPSSSSSSSSEDSDNSSNDTLMEPSSINSSDSERTKSKKKRAKRKWKKNMLLLKIQSQGVKAIPPTPYDGEANLTKFNKFVVETNLYMRQTGLERLPKEQVGVLPSFLKGKAMEFYRQKVGIEDRKWTLPKFYTGLMNYCFPTNYSEDLRRQFQRTRQGRKDIQKYLYEMEVMAENLGDISARELIRRVWEGLHPEYQRQLRLDNLSPDTVSYEDLHDRLDSIERANEAIGVKWHEGIYTKNYSQQNPRSERTEERRNSPNVKGKQPWKNRRRFEETERSRAKSSHRNVSANSTNIRPNNAKNSNKDEKNKKKDSPKRDKRPKTENPYVKKWSKEKLDEMRAKNQCFICEQIGHMVKDCPTKSTVKMEPTPPNTSNAVTVNYAALDKLRSMNRDEQYLDLQVVTQGASSSAGQHTINASMIYVDETEYDEPDDELESDPMSYELIRDMFRLSRTDLLHNNHAGTRQSNAPEYELNVRPLKHHTERFTKPRMIRCNGKKPWEYKDAFSHGAIECLKNGIPYPFDRKCVKKWKRQYGIPKRFQVTRLNDEYFCVEDWWDRDEFMLPVELAYMPGFDIRTWYALGRQARYSPNVVNANGIKEEIEDIFNPSMFDHWDETGIEKYFEPQLFDSDVPWNEQQAISSLRANENTVTKIKGESVVSSNSVNAIQSKKNLQSVPMLERTSAYAKDFKRSIPSPIVVIVHLEGQPARALIDSGSLADFVSSKFADQIGLRRIPLAKPLAVQLAAQGSRTKVNYCTLAELKFGSVKCKRHFDIMNLDNYDIILGTPFLYQHKVSIGFNQPRIWIESPDPLPLEGEQITNLSSMVIDTYERELKKCRLEIREYARDLFKDASQTSLPPLRAINHSIPLIDEDKKYKFRRSTCPDPLRDQWKEKRKDYIQSERWKVVTGSNAMPMLLLQKPRKNKDEPIRLRTVVDL
ncbi:hypothetical protein ACEPAI_7496 [Sanghuangporus weigelae]